MYRQLILAGCAVMATTLPLSAQDRFALVVGNAAYQSLTPLPNAQQDATTMAEGLTALGFDVDLVINANLRFQRFSIQQYADKLATAAPGSVGIIYYQGHGVAVDGTNYLLPPTVAADNAGAVARTGIDLATLTMAPAADVQSVIVMDCCAANPFDAASGITGQGFAEMTAPDGVLLAYAAPVGEIAAMDGSFAGNLLTQLAMPGVTVTDALVASGPHYISSGLAEPLAIVAAPEPAADELAWADVKDSGDSEALAGFVEDFPDSARVAEAQDLIAALDTPTEETEEAATEETQETAEETEQVAAASETETDAAATTEGAAVPDETVPADTPEDEEVTETADGSAPAEVAEPETAEPEEVAEASEEFVPDSAAPQEQDMADIAARIAETEVAFTVPLAAGAPDVAGASIEELIAGTAMYPPIEGLPESLWKEQTCTACHEWNQTNLCEQATFYLGEAGADSLGKQHPYGGSFKLNLAQWARGGCQ